MSLQQLNTGTSHLQASLEGGVLTITLNRPEARNAMSLEMIAALEEQLGIAEADDGVKCVVLTGAGKGFCAGGDVKGMAEQEGAGKGPPIDHAIQRQRIAQRATAGRLHKMPKPTIASINGPAAGAGLSLALACDMRIMSSTAFLMTSFAKVGLSGDFGGTYFMTKLVGTAKAREFFFLSDRIDADDAVRLGLVNWSCDPAQLQDRTSQLAARLAAGPSVAFRYMKENLNRAFAAGADECLDLEATHHIHCFQTDDHREAASAFVAKRDPVFKGT
jgi:2-(1,2-epoxy-1,2-dihydrophenyl)acetyl-CoA isomerase